MQESERAGAQTARLPGAARHRDRPLSPAPACSVPGCFQEIRARENSVGNMRTLAQGQPHQAWGL